MLAAGRGRASIVETLIDRGASVIQKDFQDKTPLCHAARSGDLRVIKSLLKKKPPVNDGSLHEAARELHADAVKLLVKSGHDIHFPSSKHQGRSPICEMCYLCKPSPQRAVELAATFTQLGILKADPFKKCQGRAAIFWAMENVQPESVVVSLVEILLWRDINSEHNVYELEDHFYSPTMYIEKRIIRQPERVADELLAKLRYFEFHDRYYAKERMQQPPDAVGMPQRILDMDNKKWMRSTRIEQEEEDRARKLKWASQEVANRQLLSRQEHSLLWDQREELAGQEGNHKFDKHLLDTRLADRSHGLLLSRKEETYDRGLGQTAIDNRMQLAITSVQHDTDFDLEQRNRQAALGYQSMTQEQKLHYLEREQGLRYDDAEAKQELKLGGIASELNLTRQKQSDEIGFRQSRGQLEQADLDYKLQHSNSMNSGKIDLNRQLGQIDLNTQEGKNRLAEINRQMQMQYQHQTDDQKLSYQSSSDQQKISTQGAMNEYEYSRSRNAVQTKDQIFSMTQNDRNHQLDNTRRTGDVQRHDMREKFGMQESHLQNTNAEKFNHLQYTNHEKFAFQQNTDAQALNTVQTRGNIENATLQQQGHIQNTTLQQKGYIQNTTLQQKVNIENTGLYQKGQIQNSTLQQKGNIENTTLHNKHQIDFQGKRAIGSMQNNLQAQKNANNAQFENVKTANIQQRARANGNLEGMKQGTATAQAQSAWVKNVAKRKPGFG